MGFWSTVASVAGAGGFGGGEGGVFGGDAFRSRIGERMKGASQEQQDKFYGSKFGGQYAPEGWQDDYNTRQGNSMADSFMDRFGIPGYDEGGEIGEAEISAEGKAGWKGSGMGKGGYPDGGWGGGVHGGGTWGRVAGMAGKIASQYFGGTGGSKGHKMGDMRKEMGGHASAISRKAGAGRARLEERKATATPQRQALGAAGSAVKRSSGMGAGRMGGMRRMMSSPGRGLFQGG